jgi:TraX protein
MEFQPLLPICAALGGPQCANPYPAGVKAMHTGICPAPFRSAAGCTMMRARTGAACAAPALVNGNHYALAALAALPQLALAHRCAPALPRLRWLFYLYYPAHLAVLVVMRHLVDR